ncbi:BfmA/BtgA family mobilization protein [Capnocytophaga canimorsus]|uniref:BfmA/BtgA family mobilization protein n=1 Tax=Capnocytophaga canimorsus TaxID=28188 RepID=UPI0037D7F4C6
MENQRNYAVIRVLKTTKNKLSVLAKKNEKTEIDYIANMVNYVYKTGINIYSKEVENVPDLIQKLEDRIIGFMKKRELDFFVPMSRKTQELLDSHIKFTEQLKGFDIVKFAELEHQKQGEAPKFTISEDEHFSLKDTFIKEQEQVPNSFEPTSEISSHSELEMLKGKLEKAQKQREIFKKELQFLMERVIKGTGLSAGKFILNVNSRDIERINRFLEE